MLDGSGERICCIRCNLTSYVIICNGNTSYSESIDANVLLTSISGRIPAQGWDNKRNRCYYTSCLFSSFVCISVLGQNQAFSGSWVSLESWHININTRCLVQSSQKGYVSRLGSSTKLTLVAKWLFKLRREKRFPSIRACFLTSPATGINFEREPGYGSNDTLLTILCRKNLTGLSAEFANLTQ